MLRPIRISLKNSSAVKNSGKWRSSVCTLFSLLSLSLCREEPCATISVTVPSPRITAKWVTLVAHLLREPVLNSYSSFLGATCNVRLLEVRPTEGPTRVEGEVLFASVRPPRGIFDGPDTPKVLPPYDDIVRWGDDRRVIAYQLLDEARPIKTERLKTIWNDVRQRYFDAIDGRTGPLLDFVREYGPFGYHEETAPQSLAWHPDGWYWEPLGWVRAALTVLQTLFLLVQGIEWVQDKNTREKGIDNLRALFGEYQEFDVAEVILVGYRLPDPWRITWTTLPGERPNRFRTPKDRELTLAAWETVVGWFQGWFTNGPRLTVLPPTDVPPRNRRSVELAVMASTLMEFAIAQFYFDRVSGYTGVCDCGKLLPRGKTECDACAHRRRNRLRRERRGMVWKLFERAQGRLYRRVENGHISPEQREKLENELRTLADSGITADEFQDHVERLVPSMQGQRRRAKPHT